MIISLKKKGEDSKANLTKSAQTAYPKQPMRE
jgi:hypothetical protein